MVRRPAILLVAVSVFLCSAQSGHAFTPEVAAGAAAAKVAPKVLKTAAKTLAEIPGAIGQTLYLPLGLVETALCPLPGPTLAGGLKKAAKGIQGPFKLLGSLVKLPFSLAGAAVGK
ncbi:MAG: hypothetical protein HN849_06325 [Victivallales bacterium]|jgi:hypothetical protein|nr:hypothetical protein [Victivallales bacterium]MBT7166512.1 hypothetical protein [Victivallales bacterium]MBT7299105.1 hypothetical protein [Victivallales bacterium]